MIENLSTASIFKGKKTLFFIFVGRVVIFDLVIDRALYYSTGKPRIQNTNFLLNAKISKKKKINLFIHIRHLKQVIIGTR